MTPGAASAPAPVPGGGLRIGVLLEAGATEPARLEAVEAAARSLEAAGHSLHPIRFADVEQMVTSVKVSVSPTIVKAHQSDVAAIALNKTGRFCEEGEEMRERERERGRGKNRKKKDGEGEREREKGKTERKRTDREKGKREREREKRELKKGEKGEREKRKWKEMKEIEERERKERGKGR